MKTVVITGTARGLGNAMALEFSRRSFRVFGTCRSQNDAKRLASEFEGNHQFHPVDATDLLAMRSFAKHINSLGGADIVIANAGVINTREPLWEIDQATWKNHLDVNILGVVNAIQSFVPHMINAKHGTFIGISSGWGKSPSQGLAPYCASKFAVEGLIGCLALDLEGVGSRVNAVALDPGGGINTDMLAMCLPDDHQDFRKGPDWARGAVDYILDTLVREKLTGSQKVPESVHVRYEGVKV